MTKPDALILCGGEGARLGGIDKPLQPLAGRPLVEHVLARVAAQAGRVRISANRSLGQYSAYAEVFDDGEFAGRGPLAGIAIGLSMTTADSLLCVPGDAPELPLDLAERLGTARRQHGGVIAYVFDGRSPQPLCCLLARELLTDLLDYLRAGGDRPREWFARHAAVAADFSDVPSWAWSLNTAAEWQDAERRLAMPEIDASTTTR